MKHMKNSVDPSKSMMNDYVLKLCNQEGMNLAEINQNYHNFRYGGWLHRNSFHSVIILKEWFIYMESLVVSLPFKPFPCYLAVLLSIYFFLLFKFDFILLVLELILFLLLLLQFSPKICYDFGQFGNFGGRMISFDMLVDIISKEEKCWKGPFWWWRFNFFLLSYHSDNYYIFKYKRWMD